MADSHFKLHPYETALVNSRVLNMNQIEYFLWLELPHNKARFLALYEVSELKSGSEAVAVDYTDKMARDCKKPWIKAESSLFNLNPGYHIYEFSFVDARIDDIVCLYLTYHIQTDNPDKSSYVYMKREEIDNG